MGRPKGSLNSKKKTEVVKVKRGRGRPRIVREPPTESPVITKPKVSKFLGYCPKCSFMINSRDMISKMIFKCPKCDKRARKHALKEDSGIIKHPMTKKEYLESTVNSESIDMPALNHVEINPNEFKVNI
jgi:ribosomal protein L37AE/L43A